MLLAGGALLIHETRGTTFWTDEWTWIMQRRGSGLGTFLNPHDEHLSLVPIAIYKLLFATAGIRHYWPYRAVVIATHLACVLLVFVYARPRVGGYFALLAAALILFFGPGWQDILWPFQMAWLIAIGAGIGALLLLDRRDRPGDIGACVLLGISLASAGPGLAVTVGLVFDVVQRRRRRDLWIVAVPLALYALWWVGYQQSIINGNALLRLPAFVFNAAAGAISSLAGLSAVDVSSGSGSFLNWGPPLLAIAVISLVWRLRRQGRVPPRTLTLLAMILGFWVIAGVGRAYVTSGSFVLAGTGYESRYLYIGALLIVLLVAEVAGGGTASLGAKLTVGVLTIAAVVSNVGPLRDAGRFLRASALQTKVELGTLDLTRGIVNPNFVSGAVVFGTVKAGPYFAAERQLGSPAASDAQIATTPDNVRAAADGQLIQIHQLTLRPARRSALGGAHTPPTVEAVESGTTSVRDGCVTYRPAAYTSVLAANALQLQLPGNGVLISTGNLPATVSVRRFSSQFQQLGTLAPTARATLSVGPDLAPQPWHVRIAAVGPLTACDLR
jgi:hypothetical protein